MKYSTEVPTARGPSMLLRFLLTLRYSLAIPNGLGCAPARQVRFAFGPQLAWLESAKIGQSDSTSLA